LILGLDLDIHARREVEAHQRVDRLLRRISNNDQAFVYTHFILVARVLVDERRSVDGVLTLLRWERNRSNDLGSGTLGRLRDRLRGLINDLMIIGTDLDTNAWLFFCFFLVV